MIDAIHESRALLRLFERSDFKDLYVRTPNYWFFVARPAGGQNPLREIEARADTAEAPGWMLTAPHVASLRSTHPLGARVEAGAIVATLTLLDETLELAAETAGIVAEVFAAEGDLVEFERPILRIASA